SARYGVKAGEIIEIRQPSADTADGEIYLYYNVRADDTLPQLVKTYDTSVEDLLAANPGLTERQLKEGSVVRIPINSNRDRMRTELVAEEQLESLDNYKIKKNDTWDKISSTTGVSVDELKAANTDTRRLKKDQIIAVPQMKEVEVEREVLEEDPRELTFEGRQEIYDSIHHVDPRIIDGSVNVAVVLDAPTAKRDIEFVRGILLALDKMKHSSYKIGLKVIDGREKQASIERQLEEFKPHIIFATADKNFPDFLAEYGDRNKVEIVNVFNVKSDLFQTNPSMVQLQPPSLFFNDEVISYVGDRYSNRRLIMAGEKDRQDAVAEGIEKLYVPSQVESVSLERLKEYNFSNNEDYLVYCHAIKRDEVLEAVEIIEQATREHPSSRITLLGRPSWVTLSDAIGSKISLSDVRIPSRFYYDPDSSEAEEFTSVFTQMYGTAPAKSFPMYSVTGYDVARTFIPGVAYNGGDLNRGLQATNNMQAEIEHER
ncbi:MAG: LysM peptidoglycan-binding domain-containing protein, partial [Muribaculaceae bacterium]|nr:LysM peptidoglycan-binding domain-containing protein [Muribaculaceae bacterium]